jgi:DNA helicase-2/ATP-dependent DNA helicase PcrA
VITRRIDGDPLVAVSTIHAFCWSIIRPFQPLLRKELASLEKWSALLEESGGLQSRAIEYDLGFRKVLEGSVSLDHDDVLVLASKLLSLPKFQSIVANRYPYIFIDEYQDTSVGMMAAIETNLVGRPGGPVVGLFGDHWQRIYDKTCGHVSAEANFRSSVSVVEVLNKMRPSLPQAVHDPELIGSADVFHTNSWRGTRRTGAGGGHWKGDLPSDEAHRFLDLCTEHLKASGWDLSAQEDESAPSHT